MAKLTPIINEAFSQYAGAVLQSRALVDVRDCLKPSARQIFYCLYTDKFLPSKPFKKTLKAIGSIARIYIHGDSSAEGVIMRASQPFAMRYPLIEVEGNNGHLQMSGTWAAPRYTSSRLSPFSVCLFQDLEKNTISEWRDNYDDTEQYPTVLPSKGFYNIVNGTFGIGIGAASSIPQFNLRDVNEALIKLLWNPNATFEELYCVPDFATGAMLLNADEVKESMRNGTGAACKLRSVVEYDENECCLVVREIPFGVYTNTICKELDNIIERTDNPGIERYNDLTGQTINIKIYLAKRANIARVLKFLYKNTSLQSHYSINMTMLEQGRFPRVFGWKEALQNHLEHEINVYRSGYKYDLDKAKDRLHIVEGIIRAISILEEVIECIKSSSSSTNAKDELVRRFGFSIPQAEAILKITLARLARLEVAKYEKEAEELRAQIAWLEILLGDDCGPLYREIEKGFRTVMDKFGDNRRTQVLNIERDEEETPVDEKILTAYLTNYNNLYISETSTLVKQARGGVGKRIKLDEGEVITFSAIENNIKPVILFSSLGRAFKCNLNDFPIDQKVNLHGYYELLADEKICYMAGNSNKNYFVFVTRDGQIKRTLVSEYDTRIKRGIAAIKLREGDSIVSVMEADNGDTIAIATEDAHMVMFKVDDVPATGRATSGVKGITLKNLTKVCDAGIINIETKEIVTATEKGFAKATPINEFTLGSRGNLGVLCHALKDDDKLSAFIPIGVKEREGRSALNVIASKSVIKISLADIPLSGRNTLGLKTIKLRDNEQVMEIFYE